MLPCQKRQTVVKRSEGLTILRCLNKRCGMHGETVDEGVCSRCPARVVRHKRPCKNPRQYTDVLPPVSTDEMIDVTDAQVMDMIKDAGLDVEDLDRAHIIEPGELPPDFPPMSMQVWTYKEALIKWNKAGRPTRTQEEVEEIHKTHCEQCDWYEPTQKRCRGCGCKVTVGSIAVLNKLKMKTEHCPKEKF